MKNPMSIEQALQQIEAGKFSFGLVEAIQNHLEFISNQLSDERNANRQKTAEFDQKTGSLELELLKCRAELDAARRETANLNTEVSDLKRKEAYQKEAYDAQISECVNQLKQSVCELFDGASSISSSRKQNAA